MAKELRQRYGKSYYPREVDISTKSGGRKLNTSRQWRRNQETGNRQEVEGPRKDSDRRERGWRKGEQRGEPMRKQWGRHIDQNNGTGRSSRPVPGMRSKETEMRRSSKQMAEFVRRMNELTREWKEFSNGTF